LDEDVFEGGKYNHYLCSVIEKLENK